MAIVAGWWVPGAHAASWQALVTDASLGSSSASAIDLGSTVVSPIATAGTGGLGVAISPNAGTGYVVDAGATGATGQITQVNFATNPASAGPAINILNSPGNFIAVAPNGAKAYMTDPQDGFVFPIDLTMVPATVGTGINVGGNPEGIAFSPDGSTAYVAMNANPVSPHPGTAEVLPITVATDAVGMPIKTNLGPHPFSIAITPDGKTAYVGDAGGGTSSSVYPITLASGSVGTAIPVGGGAYAIAIAPNGSKAYATTGSQVVPINIPGNTKGTAISVSNAVAIAVTPDSKTLYVTNDPGGTVTPIATATGMPGTAITVGGSPRGIAITPDQAPIANFSVASAPPGSATTFDASTSTVAFGTIVKYVWNFGDGTPPVTTSAPTTSHVYAGVGTYSAGVTETDGAGTSTTGEVYTGQTASSVGSLSAATIRSVVIVAANAGAPAVKLSASRVNFATTGVGRTSSARTLLITNTGTAPLIFTSTALGGANPGDFKLGVDGCTGQTIAPGASCSAQVTFAPTAVGARGATLAFTDNASGSPHTISLTGIGTNMGSIAGVVRGIATTGAAPAPLPGATMLVCQPNFVACFTLADGVNGSYHTGALTPGPYHIEFYPPNGSPLLTYATNVVVDAGSATVVNATLRQPRPFRKGIVIRTGSGKKGGVPTVYLNSPISFAYPINLLPGSEFGPPAPCFLSLETVTLTGSTAAGVNGGKSYSFTATQKIALDYPGPGALTFSTAANGNLLNPGAAGKPATVSIRQRVGRAVITWTLGAGSPRGGENIYAGLLIDVSGMQDVFGKHGADLHGNVQINLHGSNAWQCKISGGGSGDSGGDILIDPSGYVRTSSGGVPVPGARVTLQRQDAHGVFSPLLSGQSALFSPAINPQFTDPLGHYGWNVVPGRYRVRVRHRSCRSATSRVVAVPPPVTTLTVALHCHGPKRATTTVSARLIGNARAGSGAVLAVAIHTRQARGLAGYITVRAGGHRYTVPAGGASTTVGVPDLRAGRRRLAVSYSGDGYRKGSRHEIVLVVKR